MGLLEKIAIGLSNELGQDLSQPVDKSAASKSSDLIKPKLDITKGSDFKKKTLSTLPSPSSSQVIQIPQLPLSLNLAEYKDAYSNANPTGDPIAALRFQQLVDSVPELDNTFMTSVNSIEKTYGLIVNGATYAENDTFMASMIGNARYSFKTSAQAELAGHGDWRIVEATPTDWYIDKKTKYKKVKIDLNAKGELSEGLDLLGGRTSPSTLTIGENQVTLSPNTRFTHCNLEYTLVRFIRPWMDFTLFASKGWWISGQQSGYISSGKTNRNNGILPLITTGMILVRSAQFEGNWDPVDKAKVDAGLSANKNVYVGPYQLLNESSSISSVNVAAWISELVPLSPNTNKPVDGSIKVNNKGAFVTRFSIKWKNNGVVEEKNSGNFPVLTNKEIKIPAFAQDIKIKIDIMTFPKPFESWSNVKTIQIKAPQVLEYEVSGTTFSPKVAEK